MKQEEIREGMAKDLAVIDVRGRAEYEHHTREDIWQAVLDEGTDEAYLEDARLIMVGLHSQGVVIKVDTGRNLTGCCIARLEPLIKEKK